MTFTIAMTVGSVKGAQTLTSKAYRVAGRTQEMENNAFSYP